MRAGLVIGLVVLVGCGGEAAEVDGSRSPAPGVTGGAAPADPVSAATGGGASGPASGGSPSVDPTGGSPADSGGVAGTGGAAAGAAGVESASGGDVAGIAGGAGESGGEGGAELPATGGGEAGAAVGAGGDVGGDASCTFRCVTVVRRVGVPDERTESAEDYDTCRTATIPMQNYVFRECVQGADYSSFRQCVIDDDPIDDTCPPGPPAACEVGARECQGNSVSVCRIAADMTAAWQTEEACDPTLGCSDGYCNECLPGSSHCVETDNGPSPILLAWCVSDGEGYYETTASCASGSTCTPLDDPEAPLVRGTCVSW